MEAKKPVLLSTAYLPPVHYFMAMKLAGEVYIEKHETYAKQTYRNRCEIYTSNGKLALTIPVKKVNGNHTVIDQVEVSDQYNWQVLHWRAIHAAYANSPFFLYYKDDLKFFYQNKFNSLFDFNQQLLSEIISLIGINVKISYTEVFEKQPENWIDYRNTISPKKLPTEFYLKPYYQSFNEKHGFISGLSILDVLFNIGPETQDILS